MFPPPVFTAITLGQTLIILLTISIIEFGLVSIKLTHNLYAVSLFFLQYKLDPVPCLPNTL